MEQFFIGRGGEKIDLIVELRLVNRLRELTFQLMNSEVTFGFTMPPRGLYPQASVLQRVIGLIRTKTWVV